MGIGNPDLHSLDQVLPQWFQKCGKNMGFAPYLTIPFRAIDYATKVTTGAYAIRLVAFKGYLRIALTGIDLRYAEIIPEALADRRGPAGHR
jgi:hypothetical protein